MNKILKNLLISLGSVSVLSGAAFFIEQKTAGDYNKTYREQYISENYPEAVIVSDATDTMQKQSDTPEVCVCYDAAEDICFVQSFTRESSGRLLPFENSADGYKAALACKQAAERCAETAAAVLGSESEYKVLRDPTCKAHCFVIEKYIEWDDRQTVELKNALDDCVSETSRGGRYTSYTIVLCGAETYRALTDSELLNSGMDADYVDNINPLKPEELGKNTGLVFDRIDMTGDGDIGSLYRSYLESGKYGDVALCIDGDPNSRRSTQYKFYEVREA